ncbi:Oligopeptide transport ATP-binding protein OppF [Klebsiella pneumoniae]|uniref:Oligopeptide transport ATP-binding protein OppF n=1 Tax=Klebsiella pneumoniae TaxID=573 RepID=A0A2X3EGS6_KLEPN|nr:Oligopeptide transport ATP-binding protein OppF [Klebsiella pneumoniae]
MQPFINIDLGGPAQPLLKVNHLLKYFRSGKGREVVQAVDDISFTVMKGETLGGGRRVGLRQIDHRPAADAVAHPGQRRTDLRRTGGRLVTSAAESLPSPGADGFPG